MSGPGKTLTISVSGGRCVLPTEDVHNLISRLEARGVHRDLVRRMQESYNDTGPAWNFGPNDDDKKPLLDVACELSGEAGASQEMIDLRDALKLDTGLDCSELTA